MSKEIYISSTPHETRLAIVEDEALTEIYYERENEYTLAGSIYNGRVTRVLPGMQSSFVDIGLERDAFLYITDFMEEAPDSDEFDTAAPSGDRAPRTINGDSSSARTERSSDRGERGGRGRRGGRDRDRGSDRSQERSSDRQPGLERASSEAATPPADQNEPSELGEGAPGADGNRRWRGRRGRRRGRGTSVQSTDPSQQSASPEGDSPEEGSPFEPELYHEFDGAAETRSAPLADSPSSQPRESQDRSRRDDTRGGRRDRGGRGESRGPRGFEPSADRYGFSGEAGGTGPIANAYPDADSGPVGEPIILPGESLSKYRKGDDHPAQPAAAASAHAVPPTTSVTLAPPANLYTVAEGWDGGDVLPGETLRRRPSDSRPDARPGRDSERDSRRGRNDRNSRDGRRDNRSEFRNQNESVRTADDTRHPQPSAATQTAEEQHESVPVAPEIPTLQAIAAPVPPATQPEAEYEPQDASASYRVDPLPRSEYRQSAPVLEPEAAPEADAQPIALHVDAAALAEEPSVAPHDVTSIAATGEMLSEPADILPEAIQHPAPIETPAPASPIRHEGAVVSADAEEQFVAPAASGFAPGSGQLDEEILEDEDEGMALHASSIEELDDLEEETLEGAADLGTMLREMSIDHITRATPELDEDDLEEDDLEEDDEDYQASDEEAAEEEAEDELQEQQSRSDLDGQFDESVEESHGEDHAAGSPSPQRDSNRDSSRDSDRRGGRRRDDRRGRTDRDRGRGGRTGHSHGHGRASMQSTNLPAISDLLKPGQEILVQIAKEPIAKKGARITSHIALPGRFLVFMPTVNHTGVSRKIESDGERRRLKEILLSEKGEATGGFIVRTAAEGASEEELRSDLRFLLNLWADIKNRSEASKSPALIYHDLNLVERILRDQVTDTFSAIWVDTEDAYERVLRFLQRFQPSLIRRVKLYLKDTPLFEQFGITEEINKALRSKVWLKSGGSIVINQTEALVAIDINTGKFVGKTARLEDTIVKTNLDAIPEIVRQIRLRDLGGIIIIDFIDMDERKNRNRVMAALEDELKTDRAPSKVLQFNDFGLVAITRKRVKQSLERTLSTTCTTCTGTGMVKSPITVCNDIYIEMRKMHKHLDRGDVMLRVHPEVVKQLKSSGAKWLQEMEEMVGKTILVKSDPSLHPEQFDIH
jgi:ribonuclease G